MMVLAVDTSTGSGSVALLKEDRILVEEMIHSGRNHSQTILPAVEHVMRMAETEISEVDLFAVTTGPGSFTGLRIGVSTVKGLALATGKPVTGVSTLDAMACNLFAARFPICPLLDAKRGEVYACLYLPDGEGFPEKTGEEVVGDPRRILEAIRSEVILLGDGTVTYAGLIREILSGRFVTAPPHLHRIRASTVALLGREKFRRGEALDLAAFAPRYIRGDDAADPTAGEAKSS